MKHNKSKINLIFISKEEEVYVISCTGDDNKVNQIITLRDFNDGMLTFFYEEIPTACEQEVFINELKSFVKKTFNKELKMKNYNKKKLSVISKIKE